MAVVFLRTMWPYPYSPVTGPRRRTETSAYWQPFEQLLRDCLAALGHDVVEQSAPPEVPDDGDGADVRIVAHRTRRDGPGDLFYKQMHLPTIFTVDPWGWGADHSGAQAPPDLDGIDQEEADALVHRLRCRYVDGGRSKLSQPARGGSGDLPEGYVFLPTQMPGDYVQIHHAPVSTLDFVARVAAWADLRRQPVVVKLHPGLEGGAFPDVVERLRRVVGGSRYLSCSAANVHDLIAGSVGVFTLNSGVGFEALLHGRPVATFGACDYQWVTARSHLDDLDDLDGAYASLVGHTPEQARRAARFVWFYCRQHGFSTEDDDLPASRRRLLEYLARATRATASR